MKRLSGHTQCRGRTILDLACFDRQHFPPANPIVRTKSEPGGKRGRAGEAREVRADLRQKSLRREDVDPWNQCQVHCPYQKVYPTALVPRQNSNRALELVDFMTRSV